MSEDIALCYSQSNVYPVDRNDQQALTNFQRDNSHIKGTFISAGTPFIMRPSGSTVTGCKQGQT
jgi:hypothetical protein